VKPDLGVGPLSVPAYLALLLLGFLAAALYLRRAGERRGLDGPSLIDVAVVALVLGVIGSRALAVLTDGKLDDFIHLCTDPALVDAADARVRLCTSDAQCGYDYLCNLAARDAVMAGERATMCRPPRDCLAALKFWQGGLSFLGGVLLAIPGCLWFARRRGLPPGRVADVAAPAIMLGLAIGKLGCFLEGCCYGAATDGPLGVRFPGHAGPVHPTQLYESAGALAIFALLHLLGRRRRPDWERLGWLLVLYGAWRTGIELLRDDPRGGLGPLSTPQLLAIPLTLAGLAIIAIVRRAARRPPPPPDPA
jgi:phosphatidylglycerol---prolipoprotein diacylglyceryl transferase